VIVFSSAVFQGTFLALVGFRSDFAKICVVPFFGRAPLLFIFAPPGPFSSPSILRILAPLEMGGALGRLFFFGYLFPPHSLDRTYLILKQSQRQMREQTPLFFKSAFYLSYFAPRPVFCSGLVLCPLLFFTCGCSPWS